MNVVMEFTVVSKFATIAMEHTTVFALKAMNSLLTILRVMVRDCTCTVMVDHYLSWLSTDINECERGLNKCDHDCHNTIGSYTCSCDLGFSLQDNGLHCSG